MPPDWIVSHSSASHKDVQSLSPMQRGIPNVLHTWCCMADTLGGYASVPRQSRLNRRRPCLTLMRHGWGSGKRCVSTNVHLAFHA